MSEVDDHVILAGIGNYREIKEEGMSSSSVPFEIHTKMSSTMYWWPRHRLADLKLSLTVVDYQ